MKNRIFINQSKQMTNIINSLSKDQLDNFKMFLHNGRLFINLEEIQKQYRELNKNVKKELLGEDALK